MLLHNETTDTKMNNRQKMILIVEDDLTNQYVIKKMLEKYGYFCDVASSPGKALEYLETKKFDLVLMDYNLPGMLGSDITLKIRSNDKSINFATPILALTASNKNEDSQNCLRSGMNGVVEKPVNMLELDKIIKHAIDRAQ